mgnify:CR=1 FL=1
MSLTPISRASAADRERPHLVIESLTAGYGATPTISGISLY